MVRSERRLLLLKITITAAGIRALYSRITPKAQSKNNAYGRAVCTTTYTHRVEVGNFAVRRAAKALKMPTFTHRQITKHNEKK